MKTNDFSTAFHRMVNVAASTDGANEDEIERLRAEIESLTAEADERQDQIEGLEEEIEEILSRIGELEDELELLEELKD